MKRITLILALAISLVGCKRKSDEPTLPSPGMENVGNISFDLKLSSDTQYVETKATEQTSTAPTVPLEDFCVTCYNAEGFKEFKYDSFTTMPDEVTVEAGEYSIVASNGALQSAAFDAPWYCGSADIDVKVGETTITNLECAISNVKLTIAYTEKFKNILSDVKVAVSSIYDNTDPANPGVGALTFGVDEARAGWFAAPYDGVIKIYITGKNIKSGKDVSLTTKISDVKARQWRKVNIDIKTSGDINVSIQTNEEILELPATTVIVPDDNDIIDNNGDKGDWEQEPGEPEEVVMPTITGLAFGNDSSSAPFDIDQVINFDLAVHTVLDVLLTSEAEGGIQNLILSIQSDSENFLGALNLVGMTGEMDLANPDTSSDWYSTLSNESVGIIDPENPIAGKATHNFSVGGLMSLLGSVGLDASHTFTLKVVDANGEVSKDLIIALSDSTPAE